MSDNFRVYHEDDAETDYVCVKRFHGSVLVFLQPEAGAIHLTPAQAQKVRDALTVYLQDCAVEKAQAEDGK